MDMKPRVQATGLRLAVVIGLGLALTWGMTDRHVRGQAPTGLRIAFVDVNHVFANFEGTTAIINQVQAKIDETDARLDELRRQLAQGQITQSEFLLRRTEQEAVLLALDQQLTEVINQSILSAAETLGRTLGLDLVTPLDNVVIHGRSQVMADLTDPLLRLMNAQFAHTPFDLRSVEASPQPLQTAGFFNAEVAFINHKGTASATQRLSDKNIVNQTELRSLQQQLKDGQITQAQYNARQAKLQAELDALQQEVVGQISTLISESVTRLGDESGYDWITNQKNVVLFHNERSLPNLTDSVVAVMDAIWAGRAVAVDEIPLPTSPLRRVGFVDVDEVVWRFTGTDNALERFRSEIDDARAELDELQRQLEDGQLSEQDFVTRQAQLNESLASLDQQLIDEISKKIALAVEQIGIQQTYDFITQRKGVVLHHNPLAVDELTDAVLELMNQASP